MTRYALEVPDPCEQLGKGEQPTAFFNNGQRSAIAMRMKQRDRTKTYPEVTNRQSGLGPSSAGQSGDTQGLTDEAEADSESVTELLEEGQSSEASVIAGVENAADGDEAEVHTRQVPEDDVPEEYLNPD
jgi:hypothetical protein